jgi:hypothetical protein
MAFATTASAPPRLLMSSLLFHPVAIDSHEDDGMASGGNQSTVSALISLPISENCVRCEKYAPDGQVFHTASLEPEL